jgi:RHH-type proline utilization regulon transcriptional repressor/proline dehydrogenase/delta 1-pyrroline-5-carboxylate dehydrogenase
MEADMQSAWDIIQNGALVNEGDLLRDLSAQAALDAAARTRITQHAAQMVRDIRTSTRPALMEVFLAEYGLSTQEGIALMCLAEALLRVPDASTMDALIEDKIAPGDWGRHLGKSASSLVNASTWALMLTGKVLEEGDHGIAAHLRGAVKRLGEPVIRAAVARAMQEMGRNFVLGETIAAAQARAENGYTYSFDMLGEAARTESDARRYHLAYSAAITSIRTQGDYIRANHGISVKLSALHPRYEVAQEDRVMRELVPRLAALAGLAKSAGIGLNVDAEEADRLELSLCVIGAVLADPALAGWDGFGVVVQAYGRRAGAVIDWLYQQAVMHDRRIMVRLVKGAYWDAEIKRAQVLGLRSFPVFTRKETTDVAYIAHARKLLAMTDRIYPQFATHNAHTVAAILEMAQGADTYEFQRLHGMGVRLHQIVKDTYATRCRVYAPVGAHRDLLAYLVRRLLENGANSSFVHQIVNKAVPPETVAICPLTVVEGWSAVENQRIKTGTNLFQPRQNSTGWDVTDRADLAVIEAARAPFAKAVWGSGTEAIQNPATQDVVGYVNPDTDINAALMAAKVWDAPNRAAVLCKAAVLYDKNFGEIFGLLARESGKTLTDAIAELREAVDFLRYYADQPVTGQPRGTIACISPWNFPLAIFTGQVAAALMAGNAVIAKPASETPLIARLAVGLLHRAGVPKSALQLVIGGAEIGAALTSDARIDGVAFTGSTATAQRIRRAMVDNLSPDAPLLAETGGINAMVVDSTALPEQVVRDILASAFQSAGQRCSALRCLYLQQDIAPVVEEMLKGAMDQLHLGDPWHLSTDIGPIIHSKAAEPIRDYIARGVVIHQVTAPSGNFIPPTLLRINGVADIPFEVFGPVLHIACFSDLNQVIQDINAHGYGLTFGLHSRIDRRVQDVTSAIKCGNIYVNRNQIGAVVGSQPFGGEGLSGTGPKAGGPDYITRFQRGAAAITDRTLSGPTGESNWMIAHPRDAILCLGPGAALAAEQAERVLALGGLFKIAPDFASETVTQMPNISGAIWWGDQITARAYARALADREGPILPLICDQPDAAHALHFRVISTDTTASGGNAQLLAEVST